MREENSLAKPILLTRHPETPSSANTLPVWLGRTESMLRLTFRIPGDTSALSFPPKKESVFHANLWERTCFEAFVKPVGHEEYLELNFSPSSQWAAYHFDAYREGMRPVSLHQPKVVSTSWCNRFELSAGALLPDWGLLPWRLNLSAVLEEKNGAKSYWALAHPPGAPDFHHPDCFLLELPPASDVHSSSPRVLRPG
jgi:hypothetical protein